MHSQLIFPLRTRCTLFPSAIREGSSLRRPFSEVKADTYRLLVEVAIELEIKPAIELAGELAIERRTV